MKESLVPILFGGKIQIEKKKDNVEEEKKNDGEPPLTSSDQIAAEKEFKLDLGFKYNDVVCGSSQTLAIIDQSPYLLSWGNGNPIAETYSEAFSFDKPIRYDCGGKNAVI